MRIKLLRKRNKQMPTCEIKKDERLTGSRGEKILGEELEMFAYKVGYGSYEESRFAELLHKSKYSDEEIHKIVIKCIIKVLDDVVSGKHDVYISDEGISYDDIHEHVIDEMRQFGFEEIRYQSEWTCFGWASITNSDSWKRERGKTLDRVVSEIPEELKQRIMSMRREL